MSAALEHLIENNRRWAEHACALCGDFFARHAEQQHPKYFWVGCSDSRVPPEELVGLLPGDMFVHRNIANLATPTDTNFLAALQYAVEHLHVEHVIVCGHYGCGGVRAAMESRPHGALDEWLRPIRDLYIRRHGELREIAETAARWRRLCELNVLEQVLNVGATAVVQNAWDQDLPLTVHGWMYDVADGRIKGWRVSAASLAEWRALRDAQGEQPAAPVAAAV